MEITSTNNEKIKYLSKLKEKKYRDIEKLFLVEDEHLVNEALKNGVVKEIYTTSDIEYPVPTYHVSSKVMKALSSQITGAKVIAVCSHLEEKKVSGNVIVLDNVQDPGNLGTIIRSAVAFNFNTVVLSNDTVDIYNPKVVRSSEGMIFNINVIRCDIKDFLNNLDDSYIKVTTDVRSGTRIQNLKYKNIAIVVGNEGNGVKEEIASICDECVHINMNNNCESLNVGVSASILMYEAYHE